MTNNWQRLPPFAIVFFSVKALRQLLNLYPALIGVAFTANQLNLSTQEIVFYLGCAFLVLVLGALLNWLNFFYSPEPDKILIRSGIFNKERIELNFDRIQSVSIKEPFYFRPFGLVILSMDSAGSSQNEVNIAALTRETAQGLKHTIQCFSDKLEPSPASVQGASQAEDRDQEKRPDKASDLNSEALLITRSIKDIVIHGITRNRAWIFIALAWPLFERMEGLVYGVFERLGFDISAWLGAQSSAVLFATITVLLLLFLALTSLLSVVGSIFALANYRLSYGDGSYQRNSGLLNKHEIKVKRSRLQAIIYEKNWLDIVFNRAVLTLEPFSSGAGQNAMDSLMQKILVPSIRDEEFDELAAHVWAKFSVKRHAFRPISRFYIVRKFINYALVLGLGISAVAFNLDQPGILAFLLLVPLLLPVLYLRWRRYGWQSVGDFIVLRSGFIGHSYVCFPRFKIQQAQYHQSLMLERRGLASISFVLASRRVTIPFISEIDAKQLVDQSIADAEFSGLSWM